MKCSKCWFEYHNPKQVIDDKIVVPFEPKFCPECGAECATLITTMELSP